MYITGRRNRDLKKNYILVSIWVFDALPRLSSMAQYRVFLGGGFRMSLWALGLEVSLGYVCVLVALPPAGGGTPPGLEYGGGAPF